MSRFQILGILLGAAAAYVAATLCAKSLAQRGFPLPPAERRIGCVDGLRGIVALSVLVHHFVIWIQVSRLGGGWAAPSIHLFNQLGAGSVALFFMITGLVFYPRILTGFRACSWPALLVTRVCRIVPLTIVSVLVATVIIATRTGHGPGSDYPINAAKWIAAWGEPPLLGYPDSGRLNAYVLWSLWYEWVFYLVVLPACALAMDRMRGRVASWTLPVALLLGAFAAQALRVPWSIFTYLPLFACGMIAYECQRREHISQWLRTRAATGAAIGALAIGMLAFETPLAGGMPFFAAFFICVAGGNTIGGVLRTKAALVLGECSYGIYVLHGLILNVLFEDASGLLRVIPTNALPVLLPLAMVAAVGVTPLTYLSVERPMIRLGSRLAKSWTGRALRPNAREVEVAP